ncbi:MAG: hypothetical protein RLZZ511_309 [Cyanobacteriota bacterium]|jgi:uncharacterized protein YjbI with pentapeptide repeats
MQETRLILGIIAVIAGGQAIWELLLGPRATVQDVTQQVFQTWDPKALANVVNSEFFIRPDRTTPDGQMISVAEDNLQELLSLYREQLGPLQRFQVVEEKISQSRLHRSGKAVYATYKLEAQFAKAPATVRLYLERYGNWRVHHFIIQSPALSPCLSQVDWQLCSANQARRNTPDHVATLKAQLQFQRQCIGCDLSYLDLRSLDLAGVNLRQANLTGTRFQEANLQNANLQNTNLHRTQFQQANLKNANLSAAIGPGTRFQQANLQNANLQNAQLAHANFAQANLQGSQLDRADLEAANFYRADLHHAQLNQSTLFAADFRQARMTRTQMNGANLQCASLSGAAALRVQIEGALLDGTILPNQMVHLPTTLARRKDVVLRC